MRKALRVFCSLVLLLTFIVLASCDNCNTNVFKDSYTIEFYDNESLRTLLYREKFELGAQIEYKGKPTSELTYDDGDFIYIFDSWDHELGLASKNDKFYAKYKVSGEVQKIYEKVDQLDPTCENAGIKAYYHLKDSNRFFEDPNGTKEIANLNSWKQGEGKIDALGHNKGSMVKENEVAATCEVAGSYDEVYYCTRCNKELERNHKVVDALGHNFGAWQQSLAPTCTEKGTEERVCSLCGAKETREIAALGHTAGTKQNENVVPATCEVAGSHDEVVRCSVCNEIMSSEHKVDSALGHNYGEWQQSKAPTCTLPGEEQRVCANDPTHVETREVAALGHTAGAKQNENVVPATCEVAGSHDEVIRCSVCNEILSSEHKEDPALGHNYGEWELILNPTCEEPGEEERVCENDETHIETRPIAALGHDLSFVAAVAATCDSDGVEAHYVCSRCQKLFSDKLGEDEVTLDELKIEALGHVWGLVTYTWADDNSSVTARVVCSKDSSHVLEEVSQTSYEVVTKPSSTEPGLGRYTATFENEMFVTQTKDVEIPVGDKAYALVLGESQVVTLKHNEQALDPDFDEWMIKEDLVLTEKTEVRARDLMNDATWTILNIADGSTDKLVVEEGKLFLEAGTYDNLVFKFQMDNDQIYVHEKEIIIPDVYDLVGTMNEWGEGDEILLEQDDVNENIYVVTLDLEAGAEFKVRKNGTYDVSYPEDNYQILRAGSYQIKIDLEAEDKLSVSLLDIYKLWAVNVNGGGYNVSNFTLQANGELKASIYILNGESIMIGKNNSYMSDLTIAEGDSENINNVSSFVERRFAIITGNKTIDVYLKPDNSVWVTGYEEPEVEAVFAFFIGEEEQELTDILDPLNNPDENRHIYEFTLAKGEVLSATKDDVAEKLHQEEAELDSYTAPKNGTKVTVFVNKDEVLYISVLVPETVVEVLVDSEKVTPTSIDAGEDNKFAYKLLLAKDAVLKVKLDGELVKLHLEEQELDEYEVLADYAEIKIYVNNSDEVYLVITELENAYALVLGENQIINLIHNDNALDPSFDEWMISENLVLQEKTEIRAHNLITEATWTILNITDGSTQKLVIENEKLYLEAGTYDNLVLKFKMDDDQIYVHEKDYFDLAGTMNEWGEDGKILLEQDSNNENIYTIVLDLEEGAQFKVRKNGLYDEAYPADNYQILRAGSYQIKLDLEAEDKLTVTLLDAYKVWLVNSDNGAYHFVSMVLQANGELKATVSINSGDSIQIAKNNSTMSNLTVAEGDSENINNVSEFVNNRFPVITGDKYVEVYLKPDNSVWVTGYEAPEPELEAKSGLVYFTKPANWSDTINAYAWNGEEVNAEWPGVAMEYVGQNDFNESIFKIEVVEMKQIIFNDGNNQTDNINLEDLFANDNNAAAIDGEDIVFWKYIAPVGMEELEVTDADNTGIKILKQGDDDVVDHAVIEAKEEASANFLLENEVALASFDIKVYDEDNQLLTELDKPIKITFAIPENVEASQLIIVHIHNDERVEYKGEQLIVEDGKVSIMVDKLSEFILVKEVEHELVAKSGLVYFTKPANWGENVNAYAWNGDEVNAEWPGLAMEYVGQNDFNESIFKIEVVEMKQIVFNDGSNQTDNINLEDLFANDNNAASLDGDDVVFWKYVEPVEPVFDFYIGETKQENLVDKLDPENNNDNNKHIYEFTLAKGEVLSVKKNGEAEKLHQNDQELDSFEATIDDTKVTVYVNEFYVLYIAVSEPVIPDNFEVFIGEVKQTLENQKEASDQNNQFVYEVSLAKDEVLTVKNNDVVLKLHNGENQMNSFTASVNDTTVMIYINNAGEVYIVVSEPVVVPDNFEVFIGEVKQTLENKKEASDQNNQFVYEVTLAKDEVLTVTNKGNQLILHNNQELLENVTASVDNTKVTIYINNEGAVYVVIDEPEPEVEAKSGLAYFTKPNNWGQTINAYAWNGEDKNAEWPGLAMEYVGQNDFNESIFKIEVTEMKHIIFNDGSNQTNDIALEDLFANDNNAASLDGNNIVFWKYEASQPQAEITATKNNEAVVLVDVKDNQSTNLAEYKITLAVDDVLVFKYGEDTLGFYHYDTTLQQEVKDGESFTATKAGEHTFYVNASKHIYVDEPAAPVVLKNVTFSQAGLEAGTYLIWAWKLNSDGQAYEAVLAEGKLTAELPEGLDKYIVLLLKENQTEPGENWVNVEKKTDDLDLSYDEENEFVWFNDTDWFLVGSNNSWAETDKLTLSVETPDGAKAQYEIKGVELAANAELMFKKGHTYLGYDTLEGGCQALFDRVTSEGDDDNNIKVKEAGLYDFYVKVFDDGYLIWAAKQEVQEVISATKNNEALVLVDVLDPDQNPSGNKHVYEIELAIDDVVVFKADDVTLDFYHWDQSLNNGEGGEAKDGSSFTATKAGVHTFFVNKDNHMYVAEPEELEAKVTYVLTMPEGIVGKVLAHAFGAGFLEKDVELVISEGKANLELEEKYTGLVVVELKENETTYGDNWVNVLHKTDDLVLDPSVLAMDIVWFNDTDWFLVGSTNNWAETDKLSLSAETPEGALAQYQIIGVELAANAELMFKKGHIYLGYDTLEGGCQALFDRVTSQGDDDNNIKVKEAGLYDFYVKEYSDGYLIWAAKQAEQQEEITATKNNEVLVLVDVKDNQSTNLAEYKITLAIDDVLVFKYGEDTLGFYHYDTTQQEEVKDGESFTATKAGEHTFYVNASKHIYVAEPGSILPDYYELVGTMNEWGEGNQILLVQDSENENIYAVILDLEAGAEFKVRKNGTYDVSYPEDNYQILRAGSYQIKIDLAAEDKLVVSLLDAYRVWLINSDNGAYHFVSMVLQANGELKATVSINSGDSIQIAKNNSTMSNLTVAEGDSENINNVSEFVNNRFPIITGDKNVEVYLKPDNSVWVTGYEAPQAEITATKNNEALVLVDVKDNQSENLAEYKITLAIDDVLVFKYGEETLGFYHYDTTLQQEVKDGESFTATKAGEHTFYANASKHIYVSEPAAPVLLKSVTFSQTGLEAGTYLIWAWKLNSDGQSYEAVLAEGKLTAELPEGLDKYIVLLLKENQTEPGENWVNVDKKTDDLDLSYDEENEFVWFNDTDWFLVGSSNNWAETDKLSLSAETPEGALAQYQIIGVELAVNAELMFKKGHIYLGYDTLEGGCQALFDRVTSQGDDDNNIKVKEAGLYDFYVKEYSDGYLIWAAKQAEEPKEITATKNNEALALVDVKDNQSENLAEYKITLAIDDVLVFKYGEDTLGFYHYDTTLQEEVKDGESFTATKAGEHTFYVNASKHIYVSEPVVMKNVVFTHANLGDMKYYIYAWKNGSEGQAYEALLAEGKLTASLPEGLDGYIVVMLAKSATEFTWEGATKTDDLALSYDEENAFLWQGEVTEHVYKMLVTRNNEVVLTITLEGPTNDEYFKTGLTLQTGDKLSFTKDDIAFLVTKDTEESEQDINNLSADLEVLQGKEGLGVYLKANNTVWLTGYVAPVVEMSATKNNEALVLVDVKDNQSTNFAEYKITLAVDDVLVFKYGEDTLGFYHYDTTLQQEVKDGESFTATKAGEHTFYVNASKHIYVAEPAAPVVLKNVTFSQAGLEAGTYLIWAWKLNSDGEAYEAELAEGKLTAELPEGLDKYIVLLLKENQTELGENWVNVEKKTDDLDLSYDEENEFVWFNDTDWFLVGSNNNWGETDKLTLSLEAPEGAKAQYEIIGVELAANAELMFKQGHTYLGYDTLEGGCQALFDRVTSQGDDDNNIKVKEAGLYDFYVKEFDDGYLIWASKQEVQPVEPVFEFYIGETKQENLVDKLDPENNNDNNKHIYEFILANGEVLSAKKNGEAEKLHQGEQELNNFTATKDDTKVTVYVNASYVLYINVSEPGNEPVVGDRVVYFSNNKGWENVYVYAWNDDGNNHDWPGVAMTFVEENEYHEKIYKATIIADYDMIIFNNGSGAQTDDIDLSTVSLNGFYLIGDNSPFDYGTYDYIATAPKQPLVVTTEVEDVKIEASDDVASVVKSASIEEVENTASVTTLLEIEASELCAVYSVVLKDENNQEIHNLSSPIVVTLPAPQNVDNFVIKHIHNGVVIATYTSSQYTINGDGTVSIELSQLSEFAFVKVSSTEPQPTTQTIYFTNNWLWEQVYAYAWNDDGNNHDWPGVAMTKVGTNDQNQDIYSITLDSGFTKIIFNNGNGTQSQNIDIDLSEHNAYYLKDDGTGGRWDYIPPVVTPKYTITFVDEDNSVLDTQEVNEGSLPVYAGITPSKAVADEDKATICSYSWAWDKQIVNASADATYKVVYSPVSHSAAAAVHENEVASTCSAKGSYDEVVYCSVCNRELSRTPHETDKLAHTPGEAVEENVIDSTCSALGSYDEVVYCSVCHAELSRTQKEIAKKDHTVVNDPAVAATCTEAGKTAGSHCSVCNQVIVAQEVVQALGHDMAHVDLVAATEDDNGILEHYHCSRCGKDFADELGENELSSVIIPATGDTHVAHLVHHEFKDSTCTVTGNLEYWQCSKCNKLFSDANAENEVSSDDLIIAKKAHTSSGIIIEAGVAATCTTAGYHYEVYKCTVCQEELSRTQVPDAALGHTAGSTVVENEVAATCTEAGSYDSVKYCTVCSAEVSRVHHVVEATGHTAGEIKIENGVAATCTEAGSYDSVSRCTVCNTILSSDHTVLPALGHQMSHIEQQVATTSANGNIEYWHCTRCNKNYLEEAGTTLVTDTVIPQYSGARYILAANGEDDIPFNGTTVTHDLVVKGYSVYDKGIANNLVITLKAGSSEHVSVSAGLITVLNAGNYTINLNTSNFEVEVLLNAAFSVLLNNDMVPLVRNYDNNDWNEYQLLNYQITEDTEVRFHNNALNETWTEKNLDNNSTNRAFVIDQVVTMMVLKPGQYDIYLKLPKTGNQSNSVYIGLDEAYGLTNEETIQQGLILHAWNWSYVNIDGALDDIKAAGYTTIQVSPVQAPKDYNAYWTGMMPYGSDAGNWWKMYQPISLDVADGNTWLGTRAQFETMCTHAHQKGLKVIVDIVANHMANNGGEYTINDAIPNDIKQYFRDFNGTSGVSNWNDRGEVVTHSMGQPDLKTETEFVQNKIIALLEQCIDLGADGFRFDAAKHIETPDDSFSSNFWPNVIWSATSYALRTQGKFIYSYGEILDGSIDAYSGRSIYSLYTPYMSVTDNATSRSARDGYADNYHVAANKAVLWAESHDLFADAYGANSIPEEKYINRVWALLASRANATSLYFARPGSLNQMGAIGSEAYKWSEVAAVNNFHNTFIGGDEYISRGGNFEMVERRLGDKAGVVFVNRNGYETSVSGLSSVYLEDGTYTDLISGNKFTVSNHQISGQMGYTGIVVLISGLSSPVTAKVNGTEREIINVKNESDTQNLAVYNLVLNDGDKVTFTYEGNQLDINTDNNKEFTATGAGKYTFYYSKDGKVYATGPVAIATEGITIGLLPNANWKDANARFAAFIYTSGQGAIWKGLVEDGNIYKVSLTAEEINTYSNIIFVRMDPSDTTNDWANRWDQTLDLDMQHSDKVYVLANDSWTETESDHGQWQDYDSVYVAPTPLDTETNTYYVALEEGNDFASDGAVIAAWVWADNFDGAFIPTTEIYNYNYNDNQRYIVYRFEASKSYTDAVIVRLKPSTAENYSSTNGGLNWDNKWNQTVDLELNAENPCYDLRTMTWSGGDDSKATGAGWIAVYHIQFKVSQELYGETYVPAGFRINKPTPNPTKPADAQYTYTFSMWSYDGGSYNQPGFATQDRIYYAFFNSTVNYYTITWLDSDDSVLGSAQIAYGQVPSRANPTKESTNTTVYTFTGWTPEVVAVTGNATYKATYSEEPRTYSIRFWKEDGSGKYSVSSYEYGATISYVPSPSKASTAEFSYTFAGWRVGANGTDVIPSNSLPVVTQTVDYYATFNATTRSYTVTWKDEDGTVLETDNNVLYGVVPTYDGETPSKENTQEHTYMFTGWSDGSNVYATNNIPAVTGAVIYTAVFSESNQSYTVTFVDEDGETILKAATSYVYGTAADDIVKPANPTKAQTAEYTYTFAGWTPEVQDVIGNATYRATYQATKNSYTITWKNYDNSTIGTDTVEYGVVPSHADTVRESTAQYEYPFTGWTPEVVAVTGNATYTATFGQTTRKYTVSFCDGLNVISTGQYDYGTSASSIRPANPTKYGYTFKKWSPTVEDVQRDIEYNAEWTAKYDMKKNGVITAFENVKPDGSSDNVVVVLTLAIGDEIEFAYGWEALLFQLGENNTPDVYEAPLDGEYTFYINDQNKIYVVDPSTQSTITYTVTSLPNWIQSDGCVVFAWVWSQNDSGSWKTLTYDPSDSTKATFEVDEELTGFLLVRCVAGTTTPSWSTTGNNAGRIYNKTSDINTSSNVTTYAASSWVEYSPN